MVAVGLTPVDDVFMIHAAATQQAVARQPRQPATAPACEVTSPPSVHIADRNLGIRTGERYVQEWAIYPTSEGGDYYTFINALRQDRWQSAATRINGTGYLSMNSNLPLIDYSELENAGAQDVAQRSPAYLSCVHVLCLCLPTGCCSGTRRLEIP